MNGFSRLPEQAGYVGRLLQQPPHRQQKWSIHTRCTRQLLKRPTLTSFHPTSCRAHTRLQVSEQPSLPEVRAEPEVRAGRSAMADTPDRNVDLSQFSPMIDATVVRRYRANYNLDDEIG